MGNVIGIQFSCDQVITGCCNCFGKYGTYVHNLKENVEALQTALQRLQELRDDVTTRVRVCENNGLYPLARVEGWLRRVEVKEDQVINLSIGKTQEIDRFCAGGYCSKKCISSYKYGKRVAKKLTEVKDLTSEGSFTEVGQEGPLPVVDERPIGTTIGLDAILNKVWNSLMEDKCSILGLYGMGGVGKTTLLTRINNSFLDTPKEFDIVIWISVSSEVQIQRIQDDIGKKLSLFNESWQQCRQDEKALNIFRKLRHKKFVLLLDDIWIRMDLTAIGIPVPDANNGCKIVFNTRSRDICGLMEADRAIEVECLKWKYAWDLFQRKMGNNTLESDEEIVECAQFIANRCRGLPLALNAIALSMRFKTTVEEWRRAVYDLTTSVRSNHFVDVIFPLLKFSFDEIKDRKVQSSFLFCALLPEDYAIEKDDLVDYWIGEGILDGYAERNIAEKRGYEIIDNLVHLSLLIEEERRHVKMHDVIRQMALWIASGSEGGLDYSILMETKPKYEQKMFYSEFSNHEDLKRASLINYPSLYITATGLMFHNCLTLIVHGNKRISRVLFQSFPNLKVLDLSQNQDLDELLEPISELVSLQYLNLSWTRIRGLPESFKKMRQLMYLNLENTYQCEEISAISSLLNLQTLRLYNCGFSLHRLGSVLSVEELAGLRHLQFLTISVDHADAVDRLLTFNELTHSVRLLSLQKIYSDSLEISALTRMSCMQSLFINESNIMEVVVDPETAQEARGLSRNLSFRNLCNITIELCSKLQDLTWLLLAPNLTHLSLSDLESLEEVIRKSKFDSIIVEQPSVVPFPKLKNLILMSMPELKSINESPLPFPCLEHITVVNCPQLKKLPLDSGSIKGHKLVIQGSEEWINNIEWEDEATKQAVIVSY